MKVFLGGTCNNSDWRDRLIEMLKIDYFNPVVDGWSLYHQKEEIRQKAICEYCLYCITPKLAGLDTIAEVVDASNKKPKFTIFVSLIVDDNQRFDKNQWDSICAISNIVKSNGAEAFSCLKDAAYFLNNKEHLKGLT